MSNTVSIRPESESPAAQSVRPSLPAWMTELTRPDKRGNLWIGIYSGYAVAICFAGLAFAAGEVGVIPHRPAFYGLLAAKMLTNTVAMFGLKREVLVLETQTVNTIIDLVTMTGAIYLTGGPLSPLFGVYLILIAILALLTNVGVTIMATIVAWTMHSTTTLLVYYEVLPAISPPGSVGVIEGGGQVVVALVYAAFLLGVTGTFTSLLVRALRRKTDSLETRTAELIRANAQRTMLLANVTHELRTPIHGICGLAEVLDAGIYGPVTEQQKGALESVQGAAQTLLQMIDDLLALAQAEAGAMKLTLTEIDLKQLVDNVAGSVQWMMGTKQLDLNVILPLGLPDHVVSDRGKLSQILVNLLANAVKFTNEGGRISLQVEPENEGVVFVVTDTGIGMEAGQLTRIFEAFAQLDSSDEREFGGSGLGLAIVQRLVRMIDGTIEISTEVGIGSAFRVWIPLALDDDDTGEVLLDVSGTHRLTG